MTAQAETGGEGDEPDPVLEHPRFPQPMVESIRQLMPELLLAGARMLARDDNHDWCRRRGHFADGNKLDYVPDPQALLQQLGQWPLAVTKRGAGSFDDRAKKITQAVARILDAAGVSYAILGRDEPCNGDTARRLGNE